MHGAVTESRHVFIEACLIPAHQRISRTDEKRSLRVFEVGFGTGLNALLAMDYALNHGLTLDYLSLEPHPLPESVSDLLDHPMRIGREDLKVHFQRMHQLARSADDQKQSRQMESDGGIYEQLAGQFRFRADRRRLSDWLKTGSGPARPAGRENIKPDDPCRDMRFDALFFDAFSPDRQGELWKEEVFAALHACMRPGGVFSTYSAKGDVRRALQSAGFQVKRIPGPPGKREMLQAVA
jgi:tRNA U34 5-methylaminomethyl-2-thiouridine-forming methyltransferase MnmC